MSGTSFSHWRHFLFRTALPGSAHGRSHRHRHRTHRRTAHRRGAGVPGRSRTTLPDPSGGPARRPPGTTRPLPSGRAATLPRPHRRGAGRRLADRAATTRPARPTGGARRLGRPGDRGGLAVLGGERVHGRLRGRHLADLVQHHRRPRSRSRCPPRPAAGDRPGDPVHHGGTTARLASRREPRAGRRRTDVGQRVRLRHGHVPQWTNVAGQRFGPLLLAAQAGEPLRGPPLERRVLPLPGCTRNTAGIRQGHRHRRDHHRGLRDGRDPLRAPRTRRRPGRRPLGLPGQHHPVPRARTILRAARSSRSRWRHSLHGVVHRPAGGHQPPSWRTRHRSGDDLRPRRRRARRHRRAAGGGGPDQTSGGPPGLRRHAGRPSRSGGHRPTDVR